MNQVAVLPTRLPYTAATLAEYNISPGVWKALTEAVWPSAKTAEAVELALAYCKARNLDAMKRPVHIVPVWSTALGRMTEGVWPGVSELRTTAMRTGAYAGCDKVVFGDPIEIAFRNGFAMTVPEWARKTVYRFVQGQRVAFECDEVYWTEAYATEKKDSDAPNAMWKKRPRGQLAKCAEAAGLRCAFPEELGDEPTAEEMAGKVVGIEVADPPARQVRTLHGGFDAPATAPEPAATDAEFEDAGDVDIVAWAIDLNRGLDLFDDDIDALRAAWNARKDELKAANPQMWRQLNQAVAEQAKIIAQLAPKAPAAGPDEPDFGPDETVG